MSLPATNPYELLRVPRDASVEAIEEAYDRLFDRMSHERRQATSAAIETLNDLNDAREVLIDPKSRSALDRRLGQMTTKDEGLRRRNSARAPSDPAHFVFRRPSFSRSGRVHAPG